MNPGDTAQSLGISIKHVPDLVAFIFDNFHLTSSQLLSSLRKFTNDFHFTIQTSHSGPPGRRLHHVFYLLKHTVIEFTAIDHLTAIEGISDRLLNCLLSSTRLSRFDYLSLQSVVVEIDEGVRTILTPDFISRSACLSYLVSLNFCDSHGPPWFLTTALTRDRNKRRTNHDLQIFFAVDRNFLLSFVKHIVVCDTSRHFIWMDTSLGFHCIESDLAHTF